MIDRTRQGAGPGMARGGITAAAALIAALLWSSAPASGENIPEPLEARGTLADLSLEELMNVEVVTFSKRPEKWFDIPAAIFIITQEDIRRSGVTTIPEALRMAPGVEVARINANQWAIGIRGFTSRLSRSLLVLIDGRSVYSPLFAGVYWEVQDLLLEDIERIEVIRGPGGTIWGANAVNGVINIITKHSKETQGGLATLGGGTEERDFGGVRYGGAVGERLHYRVYAKYFNRDAGFHPSGNAFDDWRMGQGGFRADLDLPERQTLAFQGDLYAGKAGQQTTFAVYQPPFSKTVERDADLSGGNLLLRWNYLQSQTSDWAVKVYYDRTSREEANFQEDRDTVDLEAQHHFRFRERHELTWGVEYRLTSGEAEGVPTVTFTPARRTDSLYTAFAQYRGGLIPDRLDLTLGSKFERNNYSGFEVQPSGRALWKLTSTQVVWAGVSRAVRTPSRVEHDLALTVPGTPTPLSFFRVIGEDQLFHSERVMVYEIGYRTQPTQRLTATVTTFYNRYTNLLSLEPGAPFTESVPPDPTRLIIPFFLENRMDGKTYGFETMANWQMQEWWRLNVIYSYLRINLTRHADSLDPTTERSTEGSGPHHQVGLRSLVNLTSKLEFDSFLRYIDKLPAQAVRRYYNLDLRVGYHPTREIEVALVGQNLLDAHHPEFGGASPGLTEVQRGVYGKVTVRWQ